MDPRVLEMLLVALSNGVALFVGAHLARRTAELVEQRRAEREERAQRQKEKREALLTRLALQRRALDDYTRLIVKWSFGATSPAAPPVSPPRPKADDFVADQESIALYAQMLCAFGNRQFAEQAGATLQAARAGRENPQVFPFSVQIASACCQEMIRAISELEKELALPAPRSPAKPFLAEDELAKETTRLFSRDMLVRSGVELGLVDQTLDRASRLSRISGEIPSVDLTLRTAPLEGVMHPADDE
jgi:hypothetical protein